VCHLSASDDPLNGAAAALLLLLVQRESELDGDAGFRRLVDKGASGTALRQADPLLSRRFAQRRASSTSRWWNGWIKRK